MSIYMDYKKSVEKEINDFPMFFAFNQEQLDRGFEKLGIKSAEELTSIGGGGFIKNSDAKAYIKMFDDQDIRKSELMKNPEFVYEMFRYELANHEFCITYDYEDTIYACGLSVDEIKGSEMLKDELIRAKNDYLENCEY